MQLEILAFYEHQRDEERQTLVGTLHIQLNDFNIRGIAVIRKKKHWYINMPFRKTNLNEQDEVKYPIFSFIDHEQNKEFYSVLRKQAIEFVEQYLSNSLQQIEAKQTKIGEQKSKQKQALSISKEKRSKSTTTAKQRPTASLVYKNFVDPPKRKTLLHRNLKNG